MLAAAAAGAFALTMGARQTMGLFLSSLNSATHLPLEFDTYDTQVIDSYRTSIKTADYKKGLVRSVGVG